MRQAATYDDDFTLPFWASHAFHAHRILPDLVPKLGESEPGHEAGGANEEDAA